MGCFFVSLGFFGCFLGADWGVQSGGLVRVRFGYFLECSLGCVVRRFVLRWEGGGERGVHGVLVLFLVCAVLSFGGIWKGFGATCCGILLERFQLWCLLSFFLALSLPFSLFKPLLFPRPFVFVFSSPQEVCTMY